MRSLILKRPIACFIGLTFFISLLIGFPLKIFVLNKVFKDSELGLNYLSKFLVVYGPAISAVIITFITSGRNGVDKLLGKLKPYTIHIIWWIGLPFAGMAVTAIAFVAGGFTTIELISYVLAANPLLLLLHFIAAFVFIGIGEELGWRGWLLPKLANGNRMIYATLMVFVIWSLWHLPIFFSGYRVAVPFMVMVFAMSVLFTWLWDRVGGNVFVLAIAHASADFPDAFFESRIGSGHDSQVLKALAVLSIIYLSIAIIIYVFDRKRFDVVLLPPNERLD